MSKRRNKVTKRRNKVFKRRNKVTKRRNKVTKRRNNHINNKKLLGGAHHACYYKDNPISGVACNAYYYDKDGWYYYKGRALLSEDRWVNSEPEQGGFWDKCNDRYVCPNHAEHYKKNGRTLRPHGKPLWRKKRGATFGEEVTDTCTNELINCKPPKEYSSMQGLGRGMGPNYKQQIYRMAKEYSDPTNFTVIENNICSNDTPYLTDNGHCCSPNSE